MTTKRRRGKEATLSLLDAGNFVGQACVPADERIQVISATALRATLLQIEKKRDDARTPRRTDVLLLVAHFGKVDKSESVVPKISQDVLAEMIGTTRSRVDYNGSLFAFQRCTATERRPCLLHRPRSANKDSKGNSCPLKDRSLRRTAPSQPFTS